ncbi:MAG: hypothetical protein QMC85_01980 [Methanocellales archaeon]|nr:hypothetical protein [Methanocellales archaeon]
MSMEVLEEIFGKSVHLQILLLYYNDRRFFDNITGLTERLGKSHVTVRGVVADLIRARILKETNIGKSRVITIDEGGPYTKALLEFLDNVKTIKQDTYLEALMRKRLTK